MPIVYKMDVLQALKDKGYSTYRLRKEKVLSESTIQALRTGTMISLDMIDRLCDLLNCDVGDILTRGTMERDKWKP